MTLVRTGYPNQLPAKEKGYHPSSEKTDRRPENPACVRKPLLKTLTVRFTSKVYSGPPPSGAGFMDKQPVALPPSACPQPESDFGKRAFMRMVSHELRTPLNSIIGFAEVLTHELYGPLGAPQYTEYAGIIRDSGKKLLSLFNDVLELVRLESEPGLLRPEVEALLPHIHDAVRRHTPAAQARGVHILPGLTDSELSAHFDPRGLCLCLDHLISNAIDFTPEGRDVEITVRPEGDHVDIAVFNPGKAPDPADIPRLMRPFEQGASDYNRSREGAGLGWPVVRLAAEAMGGTFSVQSDPRHGLKATVRLRRR